MITPTTMPQITGKVASHPLGGRSAAGASGHGTEVWRLDCQLVLKCSRTFMPCQAAAVAAVRRWVARGQCAFTFVELSGRRRPAAGHDPIEHPIGRKSTRDRSCSWGVHARPVRRREASKSGHQPLKARNPWSCLPGIPEHRDRGDY